MKIIKSIFSNMLLLSVLMIMLGLPITFMAGTRFTNAPVLGTQDNRVEPAQMYQEEIQERPTLNAKTQKYYIIEKEESNNVIETTLEVSEETYPEPEYLAE